MPLCHSDTEDTEHFLLICPSLKSVRDRHLSVLMKYVANNFGNDIFSKIENKGLTIQFLLDSSSVKLQHIVKFKTENLRDIENMTRTVCFGMHTRRSNILKNRWVGTIRCYYTGTKYFIVVSYKNPLGVTHRLGEVTRQVYRYTGILPFLTHVLGGMKNLKCCCFLYYQYYIWNYIIIIQYNGDKNIRCFRN